jgi:hypothetical protein
MKRATVPPWHDTLVRVVDLLGVLREQVAEIDGVDPRIARTVRGRALRDPVLDDIEAALLSAQDAQRRVADRFDVKVS